MKKKHTKNKQQQNTHLIQTVGHNVRSYSLTPIHDVNENASYSFVITTTPYTILCFV